MKNRIWIIVFGCLLISTSSFEQSKNVKYCKIYATSHYDVFAEKKPEDISIDYGNNNNYFNFKDTFIVSSLIKIRNFNNSIDALNYMIGLGWELTAIIPHSRLPGEKDCKEFYFKKEFQSEDFK